MALNLDQLINKFCNERYYISPECTCRIERMKMQEMRVRRAKKIREELKDFPYEAQKEMVQMMIDKQKEIII